MGTLSPKPHRWWSRAVGYYGSLSGGRDQATRPGDVYDNRPVHKPDRTAKVVPLNVERQVFRSSGSRATGSGRPRRQSALSMAHSPSPPPVCPQGRDDDLSPNCGSEIPLRTEETDPLSSVFKELQPETTGATPVRAGLDKDNLTRHTI